MEKRYPIVQLKHAAIIVIILAFLFGAAPVQAESNIAGSAAVSVGSGTAAPGGDVTVTVTAAVSAGSNLGSATIEVTYDPAVVSVKTCTPDPDGVMSAKTCNPSYNTNKLRFNLASTGGVTGTVKLANLTFHAVANSGTSALTITPVTFTDSSGAAITVTVQNGQIAITSSTATATVTIGSGTTAPGGDVTVAVTAVISAGSNLGSATIEVMYDPVIFSVKSCTPDPDGMMSAKTCNPSYTANKLRFNVASTSGSSGTVKLANLTFHAAASSGSSALTINPVVFTDSTGAAVTVTPQNGQIAITSSTATATVSIGSGTAAPGGDITVIVTAVISAGSNVGSATIEIAYDPAVVSVKTCSPDPDGVMSAKTCNPSYATNKLRFNVASTSGATGTVKLANITFHAGANAGTSALTLTPVTFTDSSGVSVAVTSQNGQITITSSTATANVSIGSGTAAPGGDVTVTVTAVISAGADLGSATIEVSYDPAIVSVKTCSPDPDGVMSAKTCNPAYATNKLRFNVASTSGAAGTVKLANLTFHAVASSGSTALTVNPVVFTNSGGTALTTTLQHGQITIASANSTVSVGSGTAAAGGDVTVPVTALITSGANLGSATIEISFDPAVVSVKTCAPDPDGIMSAKTCNPAYAANKLRFNVASTSGVTGTVKLANITFHAAASVGSTALTITPVTFTDASGAAINPTPQNGWINISGTKVYLPYLIR